MPNLKDIRRRIKSVKNTQKITQAMRMVAAAKVKRAENRVKAAKPFAAELNTLFQTVYQNIQQSGASLEGSKYAGLFAKRDVNKVGVVVISSDRGLCGSYNASIIRAALRYEQELLRQGKTPVFYLVGSKVIQAFKRYGQSKALGQMANMTAAPGVHHANQVMTTMMEALDKGEIDSIEIISTEFKSMISLKVRHLSLIPMKIDESAADTAHNGQLKPELMLSPDPATTLDSLVPMCIGNTLYMHLLEASASELAARMTAMSNATNNASDMINKLTIVYNKARQASITQEILEIVSGAEALN
jgi:F-type H+-transporting ATPase subunit gamma